MIQVLEKKPETQSAGANIMVGISDMKLSRTAGDVIAAHSLGSGVGVTLYDPVAKVGGVIHCMLPQSLVDPEQARLKPCMFVDTGIATMLGELCAIGATPGNIVAKAAGAGSPLGQEAIYRLGERNHEALQKALSENGIEIDSEDVGGPKVRALQLHMADGRTTVAADGQEVEL